VMQGLNNRQTALKGARNDTARLWAQAGKHAQRNIRRHTKKLVSISKKSRDKGGMGETVTIKEHGGKGIVGWREKGVTKRGWKSGTQKNIMSQGKKTN